MKTHKILNSLIMCLALASTLQAHVMRSVKICGTKAVNNNDVFCEGNGCENCDKNWVNAGKPWCSAYNASWASTMCVSTITHVHDAVDPTIVTTTFVEITFNHQAGTCLSDPSSATCPCELGAVVEDTMSTDHTNGDEPCVLASVPKANQNSLYSSYELRQQQPAMFAVTTQPRRRVFLIASDIRDLTDK